ncbi:MAG: hypothetical protein AB1505_02545 [Candidatus Latescibacterota bacterium]
MPDPQRTQVWQLVQELMAGVVEAARRVDALAPGFPDELSARDQHMEGLMVTDYLERLARHSTQHRHEVAAIRASIGAARPTDPSDTHPASGSPYARTWYHWFLLDAFLQRAALAAELVGLTDADLDRAPDPVHTAGNTRTVRQVCQHVHHVQEWILRGVQDGVESWRRSAPQS